MKVVSGKAFRRVLERNGWKLLRIHGSHHICCKKEAPFAFQYRCMAISRYASVC